MKRILLSLAIGLTLLSCSNDDNGLSSNPQTEVNCNCWTFKNPPIVLTDAGGKLYVFKITNDCDGSTRNYTSRYNELIGSKVCY